MTKVQRDRLKLGSEHGTATVEFDPTVKKWPNWPYRFKSEIPVH